ncbi:hypothetical protein CN918_30925 [Priestia megaterium]|nr:hypothetical protein CN918_30925 [Priestia megaterium]
MNRATKATGLIILILILFLVGRYMRYTLFAPTIKQVEDVRTYEKGNIEYVSQALLYNDSTYLSHPDNPATSTVRKGKFVGRTKDGMHVYQVKDHANQLVLTGFMFPDEVYTKAQ